MAGGVSAEKPTPQIQSITAFSPTRVRLGADFAPLRAEDTCMVYHGGEISYYIYPWVVGDELYKAYQDPEASCDNPYPFVIYDVSLGLYVLASSTILLSADVEEADLSNPSCPYPGDALAITPLYQATLDTGIYILTITLDTPITVNAPYFVGMYFSSEADPSYTAILTDATPASCVSYNDWGEGYVDLDTVYTSDGIKVFPGRLTLLSTGSPGGSSNTQPVPAAQFISPLAGQFVGDTVDLWVNDATGSDIIAQARFQFNRTGLWTDIGYDYDDDPPLRNGVTSSGSGDGLTTAWNTTILPEGTYQLRTIIADTQGQADTAEISVTSIRRRPHRI